MKIKPKITVATKFSITFVLLIIVIMVAVAYAVQESISSEFTNSYNKNINSSLKAEESEIISVGKNIRLHLNEFADQVANDTEFRLLVSTLNETFSPYVVDYSSRFMKAMRLDVLEITDRRGNVLSSGYFRNSAGRNIAENVYRLRTSKEHGMIIWFNYRTYKFPAVSAIDSLISGNKKYYIVGAVRIDSTLLQNINRDTTNILIAKINGSVISTSSGILNEIYSESDSAFALPPSIMKNYTKGSFTIPTLNGNEGGTAEFILLQPKKELTVLLKKLRENISFITAVGILIAIVLSVWRTRSITRPLRKLANEAGNLSLENLELNFQSDKNDEVGLLSRAMHKMVHRLHQSRIELTAAEQKAARAEIARQVNHDLRNGFLPIRHVLEHWEEVADNEPENLLKYFNERKVNVKESLEYLQNLSKLYTRIQPELNPEPININYELRKLVNNYADFLGNRIKFNLNCDKSDPVILADKIQIRRVFENILRNAVESIDDNGQITVSTGKENNSAVILCSDSGTGISDEIQKKLFTSNITTKKEGTGLGLANVKRIIDDLGGKIKIISKEDEGTEVYIYLPEYTG